MCPMCQFETPTMALSLNHLRLVFGSNLRFSVRCGVGGCSYTGQSFSAPYSHIYRTHSSSGIIQKRGSRQQAATPTPLNIHVPSHSNHEDLLPGWSV